MKRETENSGGGGMGDDVPVEGEITGDVPIPLWRQRNKYDVHAGTLLELKVGQSVWWRPPSGTKQESFHACMSTLCRRLREGNPENRWTPRPERDGVRVWRVE